MPIDTLDATEMKFFLKDLSLQAVHIKSAEDFPSFAEQYFRNVRSRRHIVGTDYSYVSECNYNRKSFVYCMVESFSGFADFDLMTSVDMLQLIESIVSKFPRSIIMEAALSIDSASEITPVKFTFRDLSTAIYFLVLFDEWLKLVGDIFREEGAMNVLSTYRLKSKLEQIHSSSPSSLLRPPIISLNIAIDEILNQNADEISFEVFKKAMIRNPAIVAEMFQIVFKTY